MSPPHLIAIKMTTKSKYTETESVLNDMKNHLEENQSLKDTVHSLKVAIGNIDTQIKSALKDTETKIVNWYVTKAASLKEEMYTQIKYEVQEALSVAEPSINIMKQAIHTALEAAKICQDATLVTQDQQEKIKRIADELHTAQKETLEGKH